MSLPAHIDTRFRTALRRLDAAGRLTKVQRRVEPEFEVAALMKRLDGDRAVLFESVRGHDMPVVGNLLASQANCETAFALDYRQIRDLVERAVADPSPPRPADEAPCQEHAHLDDIDLGAMLPVLTHAEGDGGRFITAGVVLARDPDSGTPNASYHRLQLVGPDRTAIKLDYGRHLRAALERASGRSEPLPIAVCIGTDLGLMYAAATMGSQMPAEADELAAAGSLAGRPLEVAPCVTQDLVVPAETEIVLEGFVSPGETVAEGPFAEFIGYPAPRGEAPVFHVTAVTHRTAPVYFAINGYGRETVMLRKYVLEASLLRTLRAAVPIVTDVEMSAGGLHRFHAVVAVRKDSPQQDGLQRNVMLAAFGALKDLDLVTVVDDDIDIRDPADVEYALATRMEASRDLLVIPGARSHEYVRVSDRGMRAKVGIDATVPADARERFARARFVEATLAEDEMSHEPGRGLPWLEADEPAGHAR